MFGRKPNSARPTVTPAQRSATAVLDDMSGEAEALWTPTTARTRKSVEQLLQERGHINAEQLEQAKTVQAQTPGKSIAQILLTMNAASEGQILSALAETLNLHFENPDKSNVDPNAFGLLHPDFIRKQGVLPLRFEEGILVVGMCDPNNIFLLDEVKRKLKREVRMVVCTTSDIAKVIEQITSGSSNVQVDDIIKDMADDDLQILKEVKDDVADLEKMGSESPVIRFVNYLIFDAIKQGASDIHIEPKEKALKIRYRIDGVLFEAMTPPHQMHPAIVSRLKIMANLDIAERRLPQDGRIRAVVNGRKIDLRMSTLPTAAGEKCVMRILDNRSINVALEDLGFSPEALQIWKEQIDQPHGILLVTGPTGSGKTTTLYSSLRCM